MNVGDKVRAIHGIEEGIIIRVVDEKIVEIETSDGFTMPFVKSELVVVASDENQYFNKNEDDSILKAQKSGKKETSSSSTSVQHKGIYLAFIQLTSDLYDLFLINNTELDLLVTFGEDKNVHFKNIFIDKIASKKAERINQYKLSDFEKWPKFSIQFLMAKAKSHFNFPPMARNIRFKASTFHKSKGTAPILQQDGFIFQLDKEVMEVTPTDIVEAIQNKPIATEKDVLTETHIQGRKKNTTRIAQEIDLHIESLSEDVDFLEPNEIFPIQINHFEKEFDQAIMNNADSITFIHGVGNGSLRHHIHKHISNHPDVDFFEDANKSKFGYGATFIKFK